MAGPTVTIHDPAADALFVPGGEVTTVGFEQFGFTEGPCCAFSSNLFVAAVRTRATPMERPGI